MARKFSMLIVVLALVAAACGDDSSTSGNTSAGATADAEVIQISSSELGEILVDADGNTLYLFVPDNQGESTCYDECESIWPIVGPQDSVASGLDPALLGSTERTTGDTQATFNGWPLYHFANDSASGDTNGQGVNDVWYVISADGTGIGVPG